MKEIIEKLINKVIIPKFGEIEYEVVSNSARFNYVSAVLQVPMVQVVYRFPDGRPEKKIMSELISDTKMLLNMLGIENVELLHNFLKMVVIKGVLN